MKTKYIFALAITVSLLLVAHTGRSADIAAVASGNWSDTNTWSTQTVPGINDDAEIPPGFNVIVDTNATILYIWDYGTLTMGPNSSLNVFDDKSIATTLTFDASAPSNTVVYSCNPYNALECNYYNLVFANTNYVAPYPPYNATEDFNNWSQFGPTPMTIAGDFTLMGAVKVQMGSGGAPITIGGNLIIGTNCIWDCSGDDLNVGGNVICYGLFEDLNAALGSNNIAGNVLISAPSSSPNNNKATGLGTNGWNVGDVTTWGVGGSLTNNGFFHSSGWGCINLNGQGIIGGSNLLFLPTITIAGSYAVDNSILLYTNTPTLAGTVTFDLARTNQIAMLYNAGSLTTQYITYGGNLVVVDSGAAPMPGKTYQFFNAANYSTNAFASVTLPALPNKSWSWENNLFVSGSLSVAGVLGSPILTLTRNGNLLNLNWDSTTYPGYSVEAQTNSGLGSHWSPTGSGTVSPYSTTVNPANPAVYYRLSNP
jgi:hypothetical protein